MARQKDKQDEQEPMGIVISAGSREQAAPRYSAYVWGPAPTQSDEATKAA